MAHDDELELREELHRRCAIVVELDVPQIAGFVSGLFTAWDDDAEISAFIEHCVAHPGPVSATVCAALAELTDADLADRARRALDTMADAAPPHVAELGAGRAVASWSASAPFGRSIIVACASNGTDIDHAVLVELDDDDVLCDLRLTGDPAELVDPEIVGDQGVDVVELDLGEALELVRTAWRSALGRAEPTPGMLANQRLAQLRLADRDSEPLPYFVADTASIDVTRGMTPDEIADANAAARSTLRAAVGDRDDGDVHPAWVEAVHGTAAGLTPREREALLWLEWADWLGAGIGLIRGGDHDRSLDGELLVDLVNRCAEVSSTIHADDRDYASWAFDIAIEHLADAGLVIDGLLTQQGRASLHASLLAAWADD